MSLRRVGDDGASASSIDAAIGALADRLPVATRLNHVLTIGAKFKLEQQGKQQQQRKPVNTDGYQRSGYGSFMVREYTYDRNHVTDARLAHYRNAVAMWKNNPADINRQMTVQQEAHLLAGYATTIKDLDYLRQEDAYVCLLFIFNTTNQGTKRKENAKFMLQESLYHDKAPNSQAVAALARAECLLASQHLGLNFVFDPDNTLTPYVGRGLNVASKQREIDQEVAGWASINERQKASQRELDEEERVRKQTLRQRMEQTPRFLNTPVGPKDKYDMHGNPFG